MEKEDGGEKEMKKAFSLNTKAVVAVGIVIMLLVLAANVGSRTISDTHDTALLQLSNNIKVTNTVGRGLTTSTSVACNNVQFANCQFLSSSSYNKLGPGSHNVKIVNCDFSYGADIGLFLTGATHVLISNCVFDDNAGEGIDSTITASNNYTVTGCYFYSNDGTSTGGAVDLHASDNNFIFSNNIAMLNRYEWGAPASATRCCNATNGGFNIGTNIWT